jgi:hypothetical protein
MAEELKAGGYDDVSVFVNINEIKRLAAEIDIVDMLDPTAPVLGKLAEMVSRARSLEEFELLGDDIVYGTMVRGELDRRV